MLGGSISLFTRAKRAEYLLHTTRFWQKGGAQEIQVVALVSSQSLKEITLSKLGGAWTKIPMGCYGEVGQQNEIKQVGRMLLTETPKKLQSFTFTFQTNNVEVCFYTVPINGGQICSNTEPWPPPSSFNRPPHPPHPTPSLAHLSIILAQRRQSLNSNVTRGKHYGAKHHVVTFPVKLHDFQSWNLIANLCIIKTKLENVIIIKCKNWNCLY